MGMAVMGKCTLPRKKSLGLGQQGASCTLPSVNPVTAGDTFTQLFRTPDRKPQPHLL